MDGRHAGPKSANRLLCRRPWRRNHARTTGKCGRPRPCCRRPASSLSMCGKIEVHEFTILTIKCVPCSESDNLFEFTKSILFLESFGMQRTPAAQHACSVFRVSMFWIVEFSFLPRRVLKSAGHSGSVTSFGQIWSDFYKIGVWPRSAILACSLPRRAGFDHVGPKPANIELGPSSLDRVRQISSSKWVGWVRSILRPYLVSSGPYLGKSGLTPVKSRLDVAHVGMASTSLAVFGRNCQYSTNATSISEQGPRECWECGMPCDLCCFPGWLCAWKRLGVGSGPSFSRFGPVWPTSARIGQTLKASMPLWSKPCRSGRCRPDFDRNAGISAGPQRRNDHCFGTKACRRNSIPFVFVPPCLAAPFSHSVRGPSWS